MSLGRRGSSPTRRSSSSSTPTLSPEEAYSQAWARGLVPRWKLKERPGSSLKFFDWLRTRRQAKERGKGASVGLMHRGFGKSTSELAAILEDSPRWPGDDYAFVAETKDHALTISNILEDFVRDAPEEFRPTLLESKFRWRLPSGGTLHLYGGNSNHIRTARGHYRLRGAIVDEAGQQDDLDETLSGIILPALAKSSPEGWCVCTGTPPRYAGHPFEALYHRAAAEGRAFFMPADKNPDVSEAYLAARARELGGWDSMYFRREWLCQFVYDDTLMAVPEWAGARAQLVRPVPMPEKERDWYVGMDPGGRDLEGVIWAYYEPSDDTLRVVREWAEPEQTARMVAAALRREELELWGQKPPRSIARIADPSNHTHLLDLSELGYDFGAARKDKKDAHVRLVRDLVREGRLWVDPLCRRLDRTLLVARRRDVTKYEFEREKRPEPGDSTGPWIGHADLLDALIYVSRVVEHGTAPRPDKVVDFGVGLPQFRPVPDDGLGDLGRLLGQEPDAGWERDLEQW